MSILRLSEGVRVAVLCFAFAGAAWANSFSFAGTFSTDDQLAQILFTLAAPATVTTVTWSYAGGTDQAAQVIPEGGFDPWLSIFDSSGNLLASNDNGTCGQVPTDSSTGSCFDSYISASFNAGTYLLVLSESDNQPAGTTLGDGFTRTGQGDFTGSEFFCSNGSFCDANFTNRSPNWEVDIDNVTSAGSAIPEPATIFLSLAGAAVLILLPRRRSRS